MTHSLLVIVFAILLLIFGVTSDTLNERPIIGILTQPVSESDGSDEKHSYIAASYVKYLESSGARVVPIFYDMPKDEMRSLLLSINGVLFPGGGTSLANTTYLQVQRDITEFAIEMYDEKKVNYPIWATCLGFEAIVIVTSEEGYPIMYSHFDSWNISMPLELNPDAKQSRLLSGMTPELYNAVQKESLTMNNHISGFKTGDFMHDAKLPKFWKVLSVNKDRKGVEFISTIEARNYPIYAVQWHPEKNSFEWTIREGINHTPNAITLTQYFSNFFVQEARRNNLRFNSFDEENRALIYNYNPEFVYMRGSDFQQSYFFPKKH